MSRQKSSERFRFTAAALLLSGLVFLLPALRGGNPSLYLLAVLVPCVMLLCGTMLARMFAMDRMILSLVLWLCVSGIAALAPSDPDRALTQSVHCCTALVAFLVGGIIIRSLAPSLLTAACTAFLGLLALAGKLFSASLNLPLTEIALAILMISFASLLARQGTIYALVLGIAVLTLLLVCGSAVDAALWGLAVLFLIFAAVAVIAIVTPRLAKWVDDLRARGMKDAPPEDPRCKQVRGPYDMPEPPEKPDDAKDAPDGMQEEPDGKPPYQPKH